MAGTNPSPEQIVVSDAGPLIHLDELDCLPLLSDFTVWVPNRFSHSEVIERLEAIPSKSSLHIRPSLLNEIIVRLQKDEKKK